MADMLKTGALATASGTYECSSCGSTIEMLQGEHLPPCPSERKAVGWAPAAERTRARETAQVRGGQEGGERGIGGTATEDQDRGMGGESRGN